MSEAIELHPYDPGWPAAFDRERLVITPLLGPSALAIEHIGSTSVPGLVAKPVIDIAVLVDNLEAARLAIPGLEAAGYSFWADNPDTSKLFLVKGLPPAPSRTHHLHIYENETELGRHLVFRDHLRAHADVRDAYLDLKRQLATRFSNDREAYTSHKSGFIDGVVRAAGGPARTH